MIILHFYINYFILEMTTPIKVCDFNTALALSPVAIGTECFKE